LNFRFDRNFHFYSKFFLIVRPNFFPLVRIIIILNILVEELIQIRKTSEEQQAKKVSVAQGVTDSEKQLSKLTEEIDSKEKESNQLKLEIADLELKMSEIPKLDETLAMKLETVAKLQQELDQLENDEKLAKYRNATLKEDREKITSENANLKQRKEKMTKDLTAKRSHAAKQKRRRESIYKAKGKLDAEIDILNKKRETVTSINAEIEDLKTKRESGLQEMSVKTNALKSELDSKFHLKHRSLTGTYQFDLFYTST